jgi:phospholipid-binding lipoprotein MlaA
LVAGGSHVGKTSTNTVQAYAWPGLRPLAVAVALFGAMLGGCATPPDDPDMRADFDAANDPLEPLNRGIFAFNKVLDDALLEPAAEAYVWAFPIEFREAVHHVLSNAHEPVNFANAFLQGDFANMGTVLGRLLINTTLGVGGMIDVASDLGLEPVDEDFGQTLAVWGMGEGLYLVLPVFGPASLRDGIGRGVDIFFDPMTYVIANSDKDYLGPSIAATTALDLRSRNLETLDEIERTSVDFYAAMRSLYRQHRTNLINNGETPLEDDPFANDPFVY